MSAWGPLGQIGWGPLGHLLHILYDPFLIYKAAELTEKAFARSFTIEKNYFLIQSHFPS